MRASAWSVALVASVAACNAKTFDVGDLAGDAGGAESDASDASIVLMEPGDTSVSLLDASITPDTGEAGPVPSDAAVTGVVGLDASEGGDVTPTNPVDAGLCPSIVVIDPGSSTQPAEQGVCLCTRRDANPVGDCPRGVGQSASATIGAEGGMLTLMGQQGPASGVAFTLTIPPTALTAPTTITVTELATPPPDGFVDWSPLYRIDPVDTMLAVPASVEVPFSNGLGVSVYGQGLGVFWSGTSTCNLERLPSSYANAGFAQGSTLRFGYAIVGYVHAGSATYCGSSPEDAAVPADVVAPDVVDSYDAARE